MKEMEHNTVLFEDVFDLVLDCTWMIARLGKSLDYKSENNNSAARKEIEDVNRLLAKWVTGVEKMQTEKINKKKLVERLTEARSSINSVNKLLKTH